MNALRDEHIRAIGRGGARPRISQTSQNPGQTAEKRPCNRCGKNNHTTSECTFPRSVKCSKCEKFGHIGPACRGGKPWQATAPGKPANQGRARQVAPTEVDDATPASTNETVQAVSAARQADVGWRANAAPHLPFTYDYRRRAGQPRTCRLRRIQVRPYLC